MYIETKTTSFLAVPLRGQIKGTARDLYCISSISKFHCSSVPRSNLSSAFDLLGPHSDIAQRLQWF